MKRSEHFILKEINGVPYLLPYGQAQIESKKSCRLNEAGVFLWNLLERERSLDELVISYAESIHIPEGERDVLTKEVEQIIESLVARGCLEKEPPSSEKAAERILRAGNLTIRMKGAPQAFSEHFDSFYCDAAEIVDQEVLIYPSEPSQHAVGKVLLRNSELTVLEQGEQYVLLFPSKTHIGEAHLSKDASRVVFYCHPPYTDTFREELFHAIRFAFLYLAQKRRMVVLHSASILYQGRAWLFSAQAGTGKSTHTNLWRELLQVPLLNGDLNLLAMEEGRPVIHGIPWCGTSEIYDTETHPLGGIILLKRGEEDYVEELSPDVQRLLILQRIISPTWTPQMLERNLCLVDKLIPQIYVARLHCTPKFSAVTAVKAAIDEYLTSN